MTCKFRLQAVQSWNRGMVYTLIVYNTLEERLRGRSIDDIVCQPNEEFATSQPARLVNSSAAVQIWEKVSSASVRFCLRTSSNAETDEIACKRSMFTFCNDSDSEREYTRRLSRTHNATMKVESVHCPQQHSSFARRFCVRQTLARY
jgi:hypothetical protein